jgi:hypothetical protein
MIGRYLMLRCRYRSSRAVVKSNGTLTRSRIPNPKKITPLLP